MYPLLNVVLFTYCNNMIKENTTALKFITMKNTSRLSNIIIRLF